MSVVDAYLKRMGYAGPLKPNSNLLRDLHRAHLFAVPFENLDIAFGRKIICDEDAFLRKIIERHRGGFCYELNGAFAALLRSLRFQVSLLSARVPREDGSLSPEFDHLTLRVIWKSRGWRMLDSAIAFSSHCALQRASSNCRAGANIAL